MKASVGNGDSVSTLEIPVAVGDVRHHLEAAGGIPVLRQKGGGQGDSVAHFAGVHGHFQIVFQLYAEYRSHPEEGTETEGEEIFIKFPAAVLVVESRPPADGIGNKGETLETGEHRVIRNTIGGEVGIRILIGPGTESAADV